MKLKGESLVFLILIAVMLFIVLWSLISMDELDEKFLPILFGGSIAALAAAGLWQQLKADKKSEPTATQGETSINLEKKESWRGYLPHGGWVLGFLLGIYLLGFLISIPIYVLLYTKHLGTKWRTAFIYAVLAPIVAYAIFNIALYIPLYKGLLLTWLTD